MAASRGSYARERARLTAEHLKKARRLIETGRVPGRGIDFCDDGFPGLVLRVTPAAGTWIYKARMSTIRLGDMATVPVTAAREAAERARLDIRDGKDPRLDARVYAHAMERTGGDHEAAADAAWPAEIERQSDEDRRARGPWQWRDLVDAFLEEKRLDLDPGYYPAYASYLRHKGFDRITHRLVRDVTAAELQGIRNGIIASNSRSAAARAVRQSREMLDWAWANHSGVSGLATAREKWPLWKDQWTIKYKAGKRRHVPTVEELARTLVLAERYRTLGQTEHATAPGTLGMLWFTVLTGQRTGAVAETERADVAAIAEDAGVPGPGWRAVTWSAGVMKEDRPFCLPLPPEAWYCVDRVLAEDPDRESSRWLFPSIRGAGHVGQGALNALLYRLQGKRVTGSTVTARPMVDYFGVHGIRPWTLHDVRRAIASFLSDRRLGGAASAILDHEAGVTEDERDRRSAVTRLHYDRSQRIPLKAEGMALWVGEVLAAYGREREALAGLPAPALPPRSKRAPRRPKAEAA
ncbi:integrase arm-type DNA-binding domain-containing protein [Methylorubrum thiocyanatum]|uniref:integrase arm-type DNA-binding domain-containing protein n=1 Tax=Methylorubrum thiocyanatum TaxID=47958 RepID=UPI003F7DFAE1